MDSRFIPLAVIILVIAGIGMLGMIAATQKPKAAVGKPQPRFNTSPMNWLSGSDDVSNYYDISDDDTSYDSDISDDDTSYDSDISDDDTSYDSDSSNDDNSYDCDSGDYNYSDDNSYDSCSDSSYDNDNSFFDW